MLKNIHYIGRIKQFYEMNKIKKVASKFRTLKELFSFLWKNKLWWMMPIIIIFILLGLFIWLAQSSAVVPFIYALF